jgi:hypothetical protein
MKKNKLKMRLESAEWPHIFAVVADIPLLNEKLARIIYPQGDGRLYTLEEAVMLMVRQERRGGGYSTFAISRDDQFSLADPAVQDLAAQCRISEENLECMAKEWRDRTKNQPILPGGANRGG